MRRGVLQGCPASGSLWAILFGPVVRALSVAHLDPRGSFDRVCRRPRGGVPQRRLRAGPADGSLYDFVLLSSSGQAHEVCPQRRAPTMECGTASGRLALWSVACEAPALVRHRTRCVPLYRSGGCALSTNVWRKCAQFHSRCLWECFLRRTERNTVPRVGPGRHPCGQEARS